MYENDNGETENYLFFALIFSSFQLGIFFLHSLFVEPCFKFGMFWMDGLSVI